MQNRGGEKKENEPQNELFLGPVLFPGKWCSVWVSHFVMSNTHALLFFFCHGANSVPRPQASHGEDSELGQHAASQNCRVLPLVRTCCICHWALQKTAVSACLSLLVTRCVRIAQLLLQTELRKPGEPRVAVLVTGCTEELGRKMAAGLYKPKPSPQCCC